MLPKTAQTARLDCLEPPMLQGWPRLQAWLVHRIKRAALRQLHASTAGEILLLRMYLMGEEATEQALQRQLMPRDPPAWLARRVERHLAEEQTHVRWFGEAMAARGAAPGVCQPRWFGRRQIDRWQRLAADHAVHFSHGVLVPAYAIGLCAEQMGVRVLRRHCEVIGASHPLHPLFARVLSDEERHVRQCARMLERLVAPREVTRLEQLIAEVRAIERSFGVTSTIAMFLAGLALRLRGGLPPPISA